MRIMTRRAAGLHPSGWDRSARAEVAAVFDSLAPDWHTRTSPEREAVVRDALERGLPADRPTGACLELGSGIGAYTPLLAERWSRVRSEEHTSELQSLMRISYAVFCLKKTTISTINTDGSLHSHSSTKIKPKC